MSNKNQVISLLSDFGLVDPFVAEMKAVILSICPEAKIVDVSHHVDKFSIAMGAFLMTEASPAFQEGTIHVGVVDPGVGGSRRPIVVKTRRGTYVGPDNGLLIPAAQASGILKVFEITNRSMMQPTISQTFHGRDIFAPTAAHLACGQMPEECGPEIVDYVKSPYGEPVLDGRTVRCEILHVDRFGNIVTNLQKDSLSKHNVGLGEKVVLSVGSRRFSTRIVGTFSELHEGEIGAVFGSHGFLEIVAREKSAAEKLRVNRGIAVKLHLATD
jgi:hypothetical protein